MKDSSIRSVAALSRIAAKRLACQHLRSDNLNLYWAGPAAARTNNDSGCHRSEINAVKPHGKTALRTHVNAIPIFPFACTRHTVSHGFPTRGRHKRRDLPFVDCDVLAVNCRSSCLAEGNRSAVVPWHCFECSLPFRPPRSQTAHLRGNPWTERHRYALLTENACQQKQL
jgi:hypothetical protein